MAVASVPADALREELLRRGAEDQRVRTMDPATMTEAQQIAWADEISAVDEGNTAWLKEIIDRQGWPSRLLVGDEASQAAFLIVQHADLDPAFQARCLPLLEAAAARGEVKPSHVAYLTDRVRVKQGLPQVYGTQYNARANENGVEIDASGRVVYEIPMVEDAGRLDARRAAAGLGPWIDYERRMAEMQQREPVQSPRDAGASSITAPQSHNPPAPSTTPSPPSGPQ